MGKKLVRDLIPKHAVNDKDARFTKCEDEEQYIYFLRKKLFEECEEFVSGDCKDIYEVADIVEILKTFVEYRGYTWRQVMQKRREKELMNGGFKNRILFEKQIDYNS